MSKVLLIVSALVFNVALQAQIEIPISIDDGGYITLRVKLNDKDTATFLLDTGGGVNMVSSDLFTKLGALPQAGLHTGTRHNGEKITGMLYTLNTLSIGNFTKKNVTIGQYADLSKYDGILSMSYFEDVPFSIDFINKKLVIETKESLSKIYANAERIPIKVKKVGKDEIDLFVKLCINDSMEATAEFDTGAGFNMLMLNPAYMQKLNISKPVNKDDYGYYIYSTTLPKLSYCSSFKLNEANHFVGFKEGLIYDGLIGSGMFRNRKLTINIPESEMLVLNK